MPSKGYKFSDSSDQEEEEEEEDQTRQPIASKGLFKDKNDQPVGFFLHKSIKNASRDVLKQDIEDHGGCLVDKEYKADTVLVHRAFDKESLYVAYSAAEDVRLRKVYVEFSPVIRKCIQLNQFPPFGRGKRVFQPMNGIPAGRKRNEFTIKDDERLAQYLASRLPQKASGGRMGLNVYKSLVEAGYANPDICSWATRHPPESWKQRYKNNVKKFDARIAEIAKTNPPNDNLRWPRDRMEGRRNFIELDSDGEEVELQEMRREEEEEEEEEEEGLDLDDNADYVEPSRKRRLSDRAAHRAVPNAKKVRLSHRQRQDSRPTFANHTKGKQRAKETEEEEEEESHVVEEYEMSFTGDMENHFTLLDQPGPSGQVRSQDTLVASTPTHPDPSQKTQRHVLAFNTRFVRSQSDRPEFFGQSTPVDHISTISTDRTGNSPTHSRPRRSGEKVIETYPSGTVPKVPHGDTPHNTPPHTFSSSEGQVQPLMNSTRPPSRSPVKPSYQRPAKAARRPAETIIDDAAPYKNTRSMSRSVEPSVFSPAARQVKLEEDLEVTLASENENSRRNTPINHQPTFEDPPAQEMEIENNAREMSIETDDAQIAQSLNAYTNPHVGPAKEFSSLRLRPIDILNLLDKDDTTTSRGQHSLPSTSRLASNARPVTRTDVVGKPRQIIAPRPAREFLLSNSNIPEPRTPSPQKMRSSSESSFPHSGTRASAFKKRLQQEEKQRTYVPPMGTRAAQFRASR